MLLVWMDLPLHGSQVGVCAGEACSVGGFLQASFVGVVESCAIDVVPHGQASTAQGSERMVLWGVEDCSGWLMMSAYQWQDVWIVEVWRQWEFRNDSRELAQSLVVRV